MVVYKYGSQVKKTTINHVFISKEVTVVYCKRTNCPNTKTLSYDNDNLNVPSLAWIGLRMSDLQRFDIRKGQDYICELSKHDKQLAAALINKLAKLHEYDLIEQVNCI